MLNGFYDIPDEEWRKVNIKSNFHTHNYLCGHAGGTACEYVKEAVKCGLETIGLSDHCLSPLGGVEPYVTPQTMGSLYLSQIDKAKKRYGDRIRILSAVEIEYFDGQDAYYDKLLDKLDYIVLGQHEFMCDGTLCNSFTDGVDERHVVSYFDTVKAALVTGIYSVLAHPDLIFYRRPPVTDGMAQAFDDVVRTAAECGVAVELNANGIRSHAFRYPTDLLIELCKKYDAAVVVSSDCHAPHILCDEYVRRLHAYAVRNGLKVVDDIRLPRRK